MKNKQIIKAIAFGISAGMALQPITVFAEEGNNSEPDTFADEVLQSDTEDENTSLNEEVSDGLADASIAVAGAENELNEDSSISDIDANLDESLGALGNIGEQIARLDDLNAEALNKISNYSAATDATSMNLAASSQQVAQEVANSENPGEQLELAEGAMQLANRLLDDASRAYDEANDAVDAAKVELNRIMDAYGLDELDIENGNYGRGDVETAVVSAKNALDLAQTAADKAAADLAQAQASWEEVSSILTVGVAEEEYNEAKRISDEAAMKVSNLERDVESAKNNAEDAQSKLSTAKAAYDSAVQTFEENVSADSEASDALDAALEALDKAEAAYQEAVQNHGASSDAARAAAAVLTDANDEYEKAGSKSMTTMEALDISQNTVETARKEYEDAYAKSLASDNALKSLEESLKEAKEATDKANKVEEGTTKSLDEAIINQVAVDKAASELHKADEAKNTADAKLTKVKEAFDKVVASVMSLLNLKTVPDVDNSSVQQLQVLYNRTSENYNFARREATASVDDAEHAEQEQTTSVSDSGPAIVPVATKTVNQETTTVTENENRSVQRAGETKPADRTESIAEDRPSGIAESNETASEEKTENTEDSNASALNESNAQESAQDNIQETVQEDIQENTQESQPEEVVIEDEETALAASVEKDTTEKKSFPAWILVIIAGAGVTVEEFFRRKKN